MTSSVAITPAGRVVAGPAAERVGLRHPERYLPSPSLTAFTHGRMVGGRPIDMRAVAAAPLSPIWRAATAVARRRNVCDVAIAVPLPLYSCDQVLTDVAVDLGMPPPYLTSTTEALAELTFADATEVTGTRFVAVMRIDGSAHARWAWFDAARTGWSTSPPSPSTRRRGWSTAPLSSLLSAVPWSYFSRPMPAS